MPSHRFRDGPGTGSRFAIHERRVEGSNLSGCATASSSKRARRLVDSLSVSSPPLAQRAAVRVGGIAPPTSPARTVRAAPALYPDGKKWGSGYVGARSTATRVARHGSYDQATASSLVKYERTYSAHTGGTSRGSNRGGITGSVFGAYGLRRSFMPACAGVRFALRELHG